MENNLLKTNDKIKDVQVLRGVSILLVLMCHFSLTSTVMQDINPKFTAPFYIGVEVFFVISGYVVTKSLKSNNFNTGDFVIKRFFRLIPPILCLIIVVYFFNLYFSHVDMGDWARQTYSLPIKDYLRQGVGILSGSLIITQSSMFYYFGAMWSLSVEFQFYAAVALLSFIFGKVFGKNAAEKGLLISSLIAYILIICVRGFVLFKIGAIQMVPEWLIYLTSWRFDFLFLGVILAYVRSSVKMPRIFEKIGSLETTLIIVLH